MEKMLHISNLKIGYDNGKAGQLFVAGPINLSLKAGELVCLLGPNGVGKSTLLRTLAGIQPALSGDIQMMGHTLRELKRKSLARMLSVVLTDSSGHGNLTVFELVSLGRMPYTGWFGVLNEQDKHIVLASMERTGIVHLRDKSIHSLSDGERQKMMIARALSQDTPLILLDEPTAHLDLPNRIDIMRLLQKLAHDTGKAIVMSTHELDLALQTADYIWLMSMGNKIFFGTPEDLVLNDTFAAAFSREGITFDRRHGVFKVAESKGTAIGLTGDAELVFWTKRALERLGYLVSDDDALDMQIHAQLDGQQRNWVLKNASKSMEFKSIAALTNYLKKKGKEK